MRSGPQTLRDTLPRNALLRDTGGAVAIEFAILAPVMFALMIGVFQIGFHMQNYNAMRSITDDASRFTVVEYQKANELSATEIESAAYAIAVNPPYGLRGDQLDITAQEQTSEITGTRKFALNISYNPHNFLSFIDVAALKLTYAKPIYVPTGS